MSTSTTSTFCYLLPLRILQFILATAVITTSSYFITNYQYTSPPINFLLFTGSFTILTLCYLTISPALGLSTLNRHATLFLEVLTNFFWLGSWVAMCDRVPTVFDACYNMKFLDMSGPDKEDCAVRKAARAGVAVAAIAWVAFMVSTCVVGCAAVRALGAKEKRVVEKVVRDEDESDDIEINEYENTTPPPAAHVREFA